MPKLISQKNFKNLQIFGTVTNSTNQIVLHQFSKLNFRSVRYQIQISKQNSYHTTELIVLHNGSLTYSTEYASIKTNDNLASFDSSINGNNVNLLVTPSTSDQTDFKVVATMLET